MLSLRQIFKFKYYQTLGGWQPSDETSLEAWYKNKTGITLNGELKCFWWADSVLVLTSFDMVQATAC